MLYDISRHIESFRRQAEQFEKITADAAGLTGCNASALALIDCNSEFLRALYEKKLMTCIKITRDK